MLDEAKRLVELDLQGKYKCSTEDKIFDILENNQDKILERPDKVQILKIVLDKLSVTASTQQLKEELAKFEQQYGISLKLGNDEKQILAKKYLTRLLFNYPIELVMPELKEFEKTFEVEIEITEKEKIKLVKKYISDFS